jgi:hypothetical protein
MAVGFEYSHTRYYPQNYYRGNDGDTRKFHNIEVMP